MEKLSTYLKANEISQAEFSRRIGVHSSLLCRYLGGAVKPSPARAIAIDRATGGAVPFASWFPFEPEDAA